MSTTRPLMHDYMITALFAAGIRPENLNYRHGQFYLSEAGSYCPEQAARAMLLEAMAEALPAEWHVYTTKHEGLWRVDDYRTENQDGFTDPDAGEPEYEVDADPLIKGEDADKFIALFAALTAAGKVKA